MKFFKRKLKPDPEFTTIECEYKGNTYGFFLNWFKKDSNGVTEVKSHELPTALAEYNIHSMLKLANEKLNELLLEFHTALLDKVRTINTLAEKGNEFDINSNQ